MIRKCKIDLCEKEIVARDFCHTHYKRWQIHRDPLFNAKPRDRKCSIEGCGKKHSSIGYCSAHERQFRRYGKICTFLNRYDSFKQAYDAQVIKNDTGCWGWSGSISTAGYSLIFSNNKTKWGHRFSYEIHKEPIIDGNLICHHCDNPICTNPDHLFQGTTRDNVRDCMAKGRFKKVPDEFKAKGEQVSSSKLKEKEVIEIKKMIADGLKNTEIAKLFNVTHKNISCIRLKKTWKHVEI